jgi:hypothetical protein
MTERTFVCIVCKFARGCTFIPGAKRLPAICGWNEEGKLIAPIWLEVPEEKKVLKSIFPFE